MKVTKTVYMVRIQYSAVITIRLLKLTSIIKGTYKQEGILHQSILFIH